MSAPLVGNARVPLSFWLLLGRAVVVSNLITVGSLLVVYFSVGFIHKCVPNDVFVASVDIV